MRQISIKLLYIVLILSSFAHAQSNPLVSKDVEAQKKWVDSVYNAMTLAEKVGQLYMVQVMSNQDTIAKNKIVNFKKSLFYF